ncbi:threonine dehydratase [Cladophialophora yegresii CBS 114405]|uniref:Threonine dehydratase n=1 Tax=Cladophialophora yegresii CBS 114405 TaxID=1182544 RepID=W9W4V3_9EURO|nr:threonine dehydratase [Cladophialophora yegresii CBS 114405]EXJ60025.1 threonine dehydratase [Cladophialophora yegresii CBS 114405]
MADPSTCPPLTPSSIHSAYHKIKRYIHRTPLQTSTSLDAIASSPDPTVYLSDSPPSVAPKFRLWFKCENFQKIGAFKARGAFHAVTRLVEELGLEEVRRRGVVTHSSGNHAQALALAAHTFSIPSYIVMPTISTASKIAGTRLYTPNVIFSGSTSQEREAVVADVIRDKGAILVPPYDHPDIILGQGTAGLEMEEQFREASGTGTDANASGAATAPAPALDAVIAPLGGGGLLGGTATYFSDKPGTLVFGAEPSFQGGDDGRRGLLTGKRVEHVKTLTIADGLRTPVGITNWSIISDKRKVEGLYAVTEDEIKMAMRLVYERMKVVVEPSGCVGLAVVLFNAEFREMVVQKQKQGKEDVWDVGIVFSGGNTTMKALSKLFADDDVQGGEPEVAKEREEGTVAMDGTRDVEDVAG